MSVVIKLGILILNLIYGILKLFPMRKKVVILSRQSNTPSLDIEMLLNKIAELHDDYQTVVMCKKLEAGFAAKLSYCFHLIRQMYHIATSEIVIIDSYNIAVSVLHHRKSLLVIQIWHSVGTMKKFGYSILDMPEGSSSKLAHLMKMHRNYDYILAAGDGYREHLSEGFNAPLEKIITLPLPRVELLKSAEYGERIRRRVSEVYPQINERKNIVYIPTFRKADDDEFISALTELCRAVDYRQYNLFIKAHPLTDLSGVDSGSAIIDDRFSSFEMLFSADYVISDYSCMLYEAAVLEKPICFYAYDYDSYMSSRDVYIDYKSEMPGPICSTADEVIGAISSDRYDFDRLRNFLNKYVYMGSEHETADIVNFIFEHRKSHA